MKRGPLAWLVYLVAGLLPLAACGNSAGPRSPSAAPAETVQSVRVAVIVMENHEFDSIISSSEAPFLNDLAGRSALLTNYDALTHPSLPNYLALLGGSTFGITSDCTDCTVDAPNLADQMSTAGIGWRAYMEDLPSPCFTGASAGGYVLRHDPFLYFDDVRTDPRRCANVVPYPELAADAAAGRVPPFVWISPNLCHDMHDCPVGAGDAWLAQAVPGVLPSLAPDGVLIVVWDEGTTDAGCCGAATGGGHVVAIVAGPGARSGATVGTPANHFSMLALIETKLGLPLLAGARTAPSIKDVLRSGA
jgi:phosphatidylinositol-3-phosphatase